MQENKERVPQSGVMMVSPSPAFRAHFTISGGRLRAKKDPRTRRRVAKPAGHRGNPGGDGFLSGWRIACPPSAWGPVQEWEPTCRVRDGTSQACGLRYSGGLEINAAVASAAEEAELEVLESQARLLAGPDEGASD